MIIFKLMENDKGPQMFVISVIVALVVGLAVGLIIGRYFFGSSAVVSDDQGREFMDQYKQYQARVGSHLVRTSDLVTAIQANCSQLSSHLHLSATELGLNEHDPEAQPAAHFARMINAHQQQLDQETDPSDEYTKSK